MGYFKDSGLSEAQRNRSAAEGKVEKCKRRTEDVARRAAKLGELFRPAPDRPQSRLRQRGQAILEKWLRDPGDMLESEVVEQIGILWSQEQALQSWVPAAHAIVGGECRAAASKAQAAVPPSAEEKRRKIADLEGRLARLKARQRPVRGREKHAAVTVEIAEAGQAGIVSSMTKIGGEAEALKDDPEVIDAQRKELESQLAKLKKGKS